MAALLLLAPLLLLGTAAGQTQPGWDGCLALRNATEGNFSVETAPETYQGNTTYLVTIKDERNHSSSSGLYLLQALSPQNASVGEWRELPTENCSSVDTALLAIPQSTASWTSPDSNLSSVHIRVYLSLPNKTVEVRTLTLKGEAETTTLPSITTPNSVCRARSSSLLLLPALLLLTGALLS